MADRYFDGGELIAMAGPRDRFAEMTLDELSDVLAANEPFTLNAIGANAEMQRRVMISQVEASEAAKETSRYTRKSAKYICSSGMSSVRRLNHPRFRPATRK